MNDSATQLLLAARADLERGFTVRAGTRLRQATEGGSSEALTELVRALLGGRVPGGYREARRWLEGAGADAACESLLIRARLRYAGIGGDSDADAALADLKAAAARGAEAARVEIALAWNEYGGDAASQVCAWLAAAGCGERYADVAAGVPAPSPAEPARWAEVPPPAQEEWLHRNPRIRRFSGLLSPLECAWLRDRAAPLLEPSRVVDPHTGAARANPVRTGFTACLDPAAGGVFDLRIAERMACASGLEPGCAEPLAVLRYLPGQEYKEHFDWIGATGLARDRLAAAGDRVATLLGYLNTPAEGGATVFPRLGLNVAAREGDVLAFANVDTDGHPSQLALHAGEPVLAGEKWLASVWMRARPFFAALPR